MDNTLIKAAGLPSSGSSVIPMDGKFYPVGHIKDGALVRDDSEVVIVPWWEPDAIVAIDGTNGSLGTNVFSNLADTEQGVPVTSAASVYSDASVASGNSSAILLGGDMEFNRRPITGSIKYESQFTIEISYRKTSLGDSELFTLYRVHQADNNRLEIFFALVGNRYHMKIRNNHTSVVTVDIGTFIDKNDTTQKHIAVTYDNGTWTLFVDGTFINTASLAIPSGALSTSEELYAGTGTVYMDRYQITTGIKYTGKFTPSL